MRVHTPAQSPQGMHQQAVVVERRAILWILLVVEQPVGRWLLQLPRSFGRTGEEECAYCRVNRHEHCKKMSGSGRDGRTFCINISRIICSSDGLESSFINDAFSIAERSTTHTFEFRMRCSIYQCSHSISHTSIRFLLPVRGVHVVSHRVTFLQMRK